MAWFGKEVQEEAWQEQYYKKRVALRQHIEVMQAIPDLRDVRMSIQIAMNQINGLLEIIANKGYQGLINNLSDLYTRLETAKKKTDKVEKETDKEELVELIKGGCAGAFKRFSKSVAVDEAKIRENVSPEMRAA